MSFDPVRSSFVGERSETSANTEPTSTREPVPSGRYQEGGELGRGGMGHVRTAWDPVLARTLAVKRAKDDSAESERQLLDEARITAALDHPGIITVLDAGRGADGGLYYVMRVVEGVSFDEVLRQHRPLTEVVRLLLTVAQALASAHEHGVVHRDLSASNVRVGKHGEVVVLDWGLAAKAVDAARGGVRCGTPGFTAPELREGRPAGPTADVFSLGVLLQRALTERSAPELESIVRRCLHDSPEQRYSTATGLENDLRAWLDGERVAAHRERPWSPAARWMRRHPTAGVAALVLAVVTTVLSLEASSSRRSAVAAAEQLLNATLADAPVRDDLRAGRSAVASLLQLKPGAPEARGVRAVFARAGGVSSVPVDVAAKALPLESTIALSPRVTALFGTVNGETGLRLIDLDGKQIAEQVTGGGLQTLRRSADGSFVVAAVVTNVVFADEKTITSVEVCSASAPARFALPGDRFGEAFVMCADEPRRVSSNGIERLPALSGASRGSFRGALTRAGVVIGSVEGMLSLIDEHTASIRSVSPSLVGPVREIAALDRDTVAVLGRDGLGFWRSDLDEWLAVEPAEQLVQRGEAVLSKQNGAWVEWRRTDRAWHRSNEGAGISTLAMTNDEVIAGVADSSVRLRSRTTGELRSWARRNGGVISHVAVSPDSKHLAVGAAGAFGFDIVNLTTLETLSGTWLRETHRVRFAEFIDDSHVLAIDYGGTVRWFSLDGAQTAEVSLPTEHLAGFAFRRPSTLVALAKDGRVFTVEPNGAPERFTVKDASAIAVAGDDVVLSTPAGFERRALKSGSIVEQRSRTGAPVTSIAVGPNGLWAAARLDGRVDVLSANGLELSAVAHRVRASSVVFLGPTQLATAGWDGVVRVLEW